MAPMRLIDSARTNSPLCHVPDNYFREGSQNWFTIPGGLDAGKRLFYIDERLDEHPGGKTVLLVHGNPESSYTWRHVIAKLREHKSVSRIVAVDHIGFGLSDPADFEMVDMHHAHNLRQLVGHLDLQSVVLVVHDWGGPIGIGALIEEPDRVAGLVVVNSTVFPMPPQGRTYTNFPFRWLAWASTPTLIPDRSWPAFAAFVVTRGEQQSAPVFLARAAGSIAADIAGRLTPDRDEARYVFAQMLRTPANVRSSKRNVRQTPRWGHGYRYTDERHGVQDNHSFYAMIQSTLPTAWSVIPAAGLFGSWDPCGKPEVVAQWRAALPQMGGNLHLFSNRGHFLEEHEPAAIARAIADVAAGAAGPSLS
jgi:pimeloyl-ACP methyl ester carboxylesterase